MALLKVPVAPSASAAAHGASTREICFETGLGIANERAEVDGSGRVRQSFGLEGRNNAVVVNLW